MNIPKEILACYKDRDKQGGIERKKTIIAAFESEAGHASGARRVISDEEWDHIKKRAKQIGNPLSEKEAIERKRARIALANKYSLKSTRLKRATNKGGSKTKQKVIAVRWKPEVTKASTCSYARSKNRERDYEKNRAQAAPKIKNNTAIVTDSKAARKYEKGRLLLKERYGETKPDNHSFGTAHKKARRKMSSTDFREMIAGQRKLRDSGMIFEK